MFHAGLILHDKVREVFERSLQLARESGYLKGKRMKVALDTTNILGRGALKDTYAGRRLVAICCRTGSSGWCEQGEAVIDWADRQARAALLAGIVDL